MAKCTESYNNKSYYEIAISNKEFGTCCICGCSQTDEDWCQICSSKHFLRNEWTSGNIIIDKFVREAQKRARNHNEVIEWIYYKKLRNIKYLTKGGFSTVYKAIWLDGYILRWDHENQVWIRNHCKLDEKDYLEYRNEKNKIKLPLKEDEKYGLHVVLKSLNNSSNIREDFLNEVSKLGFESSE
jgi:serine/threonine protein kinase